MTNWISVDERLPEEGEMVDVSVDYWLDMGHIELTNYVFINGQFVDNGQYGMRVVAMVTHWRPHTGAAK